jgi:phosphoribosylaminoimidazole-succinocarboxamide synthase
MDTINHTSYQFSKNQSFYRGKVREVYNVNNELLVMIASDRLSAFDVILPRQIPYKGQILNQIAANMMNATKDLVPNWIVATPDPNVTIGHLCEPFKVEMVIRGYLAGHANRVYKSGERTLCGVQLPEGMKENDVFENPIITPTTKATIGFHDQDISKDEILAKGIVSEEDYKILEQYTRKLFKKGTKIANNRGLLLVDTKYEFGKTKDGKIVLIDEIHTPDSSRYFYKDGYEERQAAGEPQQQLSKEFVRQWLIANDFQGLEGQQIPVISDEKVNEISERYQTLYEKITGKKLLKNTNENIYKRIEQNVLEFLKTYA